MALRCKPGDLAIAVRTMKNEHIGAIVRCIEFVGKKHAHGVVFEDCWVIEFRGKTMSPHGRLWMIPDAWLRPLRGDLTGDTESTDTPIRETA